MLEQGEHGVGDHPLGRLDPAEQQDSGIGDDLGPGQLARAVADQKLSKAVLDEGIETAIALIAATSNQ